MHEESVKKSCGRAGTDRSPVANLKKKYDYCRYICGIDEAGRGPLAGPVVAGAVVLPKGCRILYINDSKKLSEKKA